MSNEAVPGSLALGLTRSQSGSLTSVASLLPAETGPLPVIGYPHTGGRCYVMNEQLSRLTPFSQQAAPGLAWRTGMTEWGRTDKTMGYSPPSGRPHPAFFTCASMRREAFDTSASS
jgi:hypothetical protein